MKRQRLITLCAAMLSCEGENTDEEIILDSRSSAMDEEEDNFWGE